MKCLQVVMDLCFYVQRDATNLSVLLYCVFEPYSLTIIPTWSCYGQGLPRALWVGAPLSRPASTELAVTGISLALLSYAGRGDGLGASASDAARAQAQRKQPSHASSGDNRDLQGAGGQNPKDNLNSAGGRGSGTQGGVAGSSGGPREDGADAGHRQTASSAGGGLPPAMARHELLRQWGFGVTLHVAPGGWAAGGAGSGDSGGGGSGSVGASARDSEGNGPRGDSGRVGGLHSATNGASVAHVGPSSAAFPPERASSPAPAGREHSARPGASPGGPVQHDVQEGVAGDCRKPNPGGWRVRTQAKRTLEPHLPWAGAEVRVHIALRALAPALSAGGVAVVLRMAGRAECAAQYWAHWRRRPAAPVAAAPAAWWRHAVAAATAACREVSRRPPVLLRALAARRARRLEYQALYARAHGVCTGVCHPPDLYSRTPHTLRLHWYSSRRAGDDLVSSPYASNKLYSCPWVRK